MPDDEKVSKPSAGYVYIPGSSYQCRECAFITPDGLCSNYLKTEANVKPYGSCNDWRTLEAGRIMGNWSRTRHDTAYMENKPGFTCGRCEYFNFDRYRCSEVSEKGKPAFNIISPRGCCNFWDGDEVRKHMTVAELRQLGSEE